MRLRLGVLEEVVEGVDEKKEGEVEKGMREADEVFSHQCSGETGESTRGLESAQAIPQTICSCAR